MADERVRDEQQKDYEEPSLVDLEDVAGGVEEGSCHTCGSCCSCHTCGSSTLDPMDQSA